MVIVHILSSASNTLFIGERCTNMSSTTWTGAVLGGVVPAQRYHNLEREIDRALEQVRLDAAHAFEVSAAPAS